MDSGAPIVMAPEETVWSGRPSHINNLVLYIVCTILVIPVFYAIWKWLELRCTTYELTTQRLRIITGVFNRDEEEIELYRVKDISFSQPFLPRMFGLGNVTMHTSDKTTPELTIAGIADAREFRDLLRDRVEQRRDEKRVREVDFE